MRALADQLRDAGALRTAGRWREAEVAYKRILSRTPELADTWYNLGFVQRQLGDYEAALGAYASALSRGVGQAEEVHLNRAVIYADHLQRPEDAEQELRRALEIAPNYTPAIFNLANLAEDRGRRSEAAALYERVLEIEPSAHEALARLAQIATIADVDDPMIARLRAVLTRSELDTAQRASLNFALGRSLDQAGAYENAFNAYAAANAMSRQSARQGAALYDRTRAERQVDEMIAAFPACRTDVRSVGRPPVFICGMFRSGSTLIEQVLAGHPDVQTGGELALLPLAQSAFAPFPVSMPGRSAEEIASVARRLLEAYARLFPGAGVVTDKRPDNFRLIGLIKALFPDAKIVHTLRSALDNILSVYFLHLDHSMSYALDPMDAAHHYVQYRRLMAHWQDVFAGDIHDVDYDAFVAEPRAQAEGLLRFLDLDWNEECLAFHKRTNTVKTASVWQVREPLYQRSSGRWRHYARQLEPVRAYLDSAGALD